ncbi:MAG: sugar phosphate isomerase/epimerase [Armatimonadetes bacterium]|nr:sugar phosphate isomerase/epimerase [Armatimonadota bacterium]
MRLGAPLFEDCSTPEKWIAALRKKGYSAAFCPVGSEAADDVVAAYEQAARENDIVVAEVGAWSSPICRDAPTAEDGRKRCVEGLRLADRIGANCCVNVSGSRGLPWYGHDPENLTPATFDLIVEFVQWLIEEVKPTRTCFTLETMEWMYPDSPDSYAQLVKAIDREHFAVHFDPTNLVCSPQLYYRTGELITEFVAKLGPQIKSCHAKDISLSEKLTVHLDEVLPGTGNLDYATLLRQLETLGPDVPLLIEHLSSEEQFDQAAAFIRGKAEEVGTEVV